MNIYELGPIAATLDGAYAVFVSIATFLEPVAGSSSAALAVVVLTLLVRAMLIPVGVSQMRADAVRRRIAPQVAELRRRYGADPRLLQRKMLELYAQEKASPVAGCLPLLAQATGFKTEKLTAIEAGYRGQPTDSTTLSVSLFFNLYDDLRTTEFAPGGVLPIRLMNSLKGHSYGVEAWATQQLAPWWRVRLGLATLGKDFEVRSGRTDLAGRSSLGNDPDYKLQLRSQMDLSPTVEFDFGMRAIDDLDAPEVSGFVEADARLGWRVSKAVELYVAGTNLLHENHQESGDAGRGQLVERSVHAGTRLRF